MRVTHAASAAAPLRSSRGRFFSAVLCAMVALGAGLCSRPALADSVNSPNITLNVDTNRTGGAGAGGVSVVVNSITIAETTLAEYSSGAGRAIVLKARPGYQFDPASNVTAQSATIGFNGSAANVAASVTPTGAAEEVLTFNLTSGTGGTQDIVRVNGVRLRILSAAGAAGPAQTTLSVTTSGAGGAFTDQGIVASNIVTGRADHMVFSAQPGSTVADGDLLPAVKIVDFGGNLIANDQRLITLAIASNPGGAPLLGINGLETDAGVATWIAEDNLRIAIPGTGYTLRASNAGATLQSSNTVDSVAFDVTALAPDRLEFTLQPVDTVAGGDMLLAVTARDALGNTVTSPSINVTLDSAVNPGGWPLLVDTSLTKPTVNGVATWDVADHLRINKAVAGYRLLASGAGTPIQTNVFNVAAANPSSMRFVGQPTETAVETSISPTVVIEILDAFNNRTTSNAAVEMALRSTCGGTLSGDTGTAAAGLALFDGLSIDTACTDVELEASSGSLPRVTSEPFNVTAFPPAALRFVQQPTTTGQGVAFNPPVSVEILDAAGDRTDSSATVELTLLSSCGGALSTTSAAAVGGLATFAVLSVDTACTAITLQATAAGLTGATSNAFAVTGLPPAALQFVQEPTTVGQGIAFNPSVSVELVDATGERVASNAAVQLTLRSSCGGALSTNSVNAVDGLATFAALSVDTACTAVTLEASAAGLTSATSDAFNVVALPPAALRFVRQPRTVVQGAAFNPPVSVEIVDAAGQRTDSDATVELTLLSSCGGSLSRTSVDAVGGLATAAVLSIDTPCTAVTLQATSDGLTGATSDSFDVTRRGNAGGGGRVCGQGAAAFLMPTLLALIGMNIVLGRRRG